MCNCSSLVRWVAVIILLVAVCGCLVGLLAPFWALYEPGLPHAQPLTTKPDNLDNASSSSDVAQATGPVNADLEPILFPRRLPAETEGLWARCDSINYTNCRLFWQNDFQLENSFPLWHKVAQVLYLVGSVILVATLIIGFLNVCCCRCCLQSSSLPTALGALTTIGVLPILASIIVYGAMAFKERGISLMAASSVAATTEQTIPGDVPPSAKTFGDPQMTVAVFEWAYYVAVASVAVCLVAAALLFCDGRRTSVTSSGEDGKGRYQQTTNVEVYCSDQ